MFPANRGFLRSRDHRRARCVGGRLRQKRRQDAAADEVNLLDRPRVRRRERIEGMSVVEGNAVVDRAGNETDAFRRGLTVSAEPRRDRRRHIGRAQEARIVGIEHEG